MFKQNIRFRRWVNAKNTHLHNQNLSVRWIKDELELKFRTKMLMNFIWCFCTLAIFHVENAFGFSSVYLTDPYQSEILCTWIWKKKPYRHALLIRFIEQFIGISVGMCECTGNWTVMNFTEDHANYYANWTGTSCVIRALILKWLHFYIKYSSN